MLFAEDGRGAEKCRTIRVRNADFPNQNLRQHHSGKRVAAQCILVQRSQDLKAHKGEGVM